MSSGASNPGRVSGRLQEVLPKVSSVSVLRWKGGNGDGVGGFIDVSLLVRRRSPPPASSREALKRRLYLNGMGAGNASGKSERPNNFQQMGGFRARRHAFVRKAPPRRVAFGILARTLPGMGLAGGRGRGLRRVKAGPVS